MDEVAWKIYMHKTYLREIWCEGFNWDEITTDPNGRLL
jgi:hypothetical protein